MRPHSLKLDVVVKNSSARRFGLVALAALTSLALAGCASLPVSAPTEKVDYKSCLITQGDDSGAAMVLNDLAEYGIKQAVVTYGVDFEVKDSSPSTFKTDASKLVKGGCKSITVSGPAFKGLVGSLAEANPEVVFLFVTSSKELLAPGTNIQNLALFAVDLFEAGMIQGYLAASVSKANRVGFYLQPKLSDTSMQDGVRAGVALFDEQNGTETLVANVSELIVDPLDPNYLDTVLVPSNASFEGSLESLETSKVTLIAMGRDLYENESLKALRAQIFASVHPEVPSRVMEMVAADLEGEFIGGSFGSTIATFGNGGIKISPEHEQYYPAGLIDSVQKFTAEYETTRR